MAGLMLLLTVSYLRNLGTEPVDAVRTGPFGVSRGYMMMLANAFLAYLAIFFTVGFGLMPSQFIVFFAGFWILFVVCMTGFALWARQNRRNSAFIRSSGPRHDCSLPLSSLGPLVALERAQSCALPARASGLPSRRSQHRVASGNDSHDFGRRRCGVSPSALRSETRPRTRRYVGFLRPAAERAT